ncbi:hypothetical protein Efla_000125 [Eimeria flavescens]
MPVAAMGRLLKCFLSDFIEKGKEAAEEQQKAETSAAANAAVTRAAKAAAAGAAAAVAACRVVCCQWQPSADLGRCLLAVGVSVSSPVSSACSNEGENAERPADCLPDAHAENTRETALSAASFVLVVDESGKVIQRLQPQEEQQIYCFKWNPSEQQLAFFFSCRGRRGP